MGIRTLKQLENKINEKIKLALINGVAEKTKDQMIINIEQDVYNAYVPTSYERTYELLDRENIVATTIPNGILVKNITVQDDIKGTPKAIAEVVETGIGYDYFSPGARPFIKNTKIDLASGLYKEILKDSLRVLGLNVR